MRVLLTGAAGFIGFHTSRALLARGAHVIGVDNVNDYYDVSLKEARLKLLQENPSFDFVRLDIGNPDAVQSLAKNQFSHIVHLAAQAGVRHSLTEPFAYSHANVTGHLALLELARHTKDLQHFVYASSSSVYGGNKKIPFSVTDDVSRPVSLYAATKRAGELMTYTYADLYKIPATGLRFFTVYGPWGRPDMAAYIFTQKILAGEAISVFNYGKMKRDFTFVDDVVSGLLAALDRPPKGTNGDALTKIYNLGNSRAELLTDFISLLEAELGRKAKIDLLPLQPGDVTETYADIEASTQDLGFLPKVSLRDGLRQFVAWYKSYHR